MTRLDTGTDELRGDIEAGVATIKQNRPDERNALSDRLTPAPRETLLDPASVGEAYWPLHQQTRDARTFEQDMRPLADTW